ncbi:hypothetical protein IE077_002017 [Cardiosporidium cionae]|uniref:Uncharacterized protein n=1 Tax=Cardiosporidium cionae TaxID=476202 RepID=A0ABQ7JBX3_9APIC|nr:hypothetical protein IE077_002017 [Cardiosporidium cionae]|eukprot:KAF8821448.1 hypothetical protein IE077_002017 [Cardiosporidium cionae]
MISDGIPLRNVAERFMRQTNIKAPISAVEEFLSVAGGTTNALINGNRESTLLTDGKSPEFIGLLLLKLQNLLLSNTSLASMATLNSSESFIGAAENIVMIGIILFYWIFICFFNCSYA